MTDSVNGTTLVVGHEVPETAEGRADVGLTAEPDKAQTRRLETRRGIIKSVGGSALARLIVLPISAILGIVVTRLIIENYGEAAYAQYILLVGVAALIPFADLGLSAAVMNAAAGASNPRADPHLRGTLTSCVRILACCAVVLILTAGTVYGLGMWEALLGEGLSLGSGSLAATICLTILGLNLLVSFGQRILIALGLNMLVVLLTGLQTPLVLLVLWLSVNFTTDGGYLAVASYAGTLVISIVAMLVAARRISPTLGSAVRDAANPRVKGERVFDVAWPMLIQMIALPLAMSSDRLVLSHLGTLANLTEYSLASQMFTPLLAVISTAGMSLWPVFARARSRGDASPLSPFTMSLVFTAIALLACLTIAALSPWLAEIASGGRISLGPLTVTLFIVFIVLQAAKYPFGMYLTDAKGLRFQAYFVLILLPLNLTLTVALTPSMGAPGPLVGSIIGVALCQLIPNAILVRRRMNRQQDIERPASEALRETETRL